MLALISEYRNKSDSNVEEDFNYEEMGGPSNFSKSESALIAQIDSLPLNKVNLIQYKTNLYEYYNYKMEWE